VHLLEKIVSLTYFKICFFQLKQLKHAFYSGTRPWNQETMSHHVAVQGLV